MIRLCMFTVWFILFIAQPSESLSDFRTQKFCTYFVTLDANHDGILSLDDYQFMCGIIMTGDDAVNYCRTTLAPQLWYSFPYDQSGQGNPVTQAQFMTTVSGLVETPEFDSLLANFTLMLYAAFNVDPQTPMNLVQYSAIFVIRGLDPAGALTCFNGLDRNSDGFISTDEAIANVHDFFFGEDTTSPTQLWLGPLVPICLSLL